MVTKKQYIEALEIVREYESAQEMLKKELVDVMKKFPSGTNVRSKKSSVEGIVVGYSTWVNNVRLNILTKDERETTILAKNAIKNEE